MTAQDAALEIRELGSLGELKRAERLQKDVWGEDDTPDNADILLAIQHEGGLVAGAFKSGRMLGFLFGFPTSRPDVQRSHRLAVHPDSRGLGLGAELKWFQRDWCIERGIRIVRWTYDPLRRANAGLNITRLGATAGIYHENYYGEMEGINAGVPSDRLVAEWDLNAPDVRRRRRDPQAAHWPASEDCLRVTIPADFAGLLSRDTEKAMSERLRVRGALTAAFANGFRIVGFDPETCAYRLIRPQSTPRMTRSTTADPSSIQTGPNSHRAAGTEA